MVAMEVAMTRPKKLSDKTRRITVEIGIDVHRYLKIQSAIRDVPVSLMVEEIIRSAVQVDEAPGMSLPVPKNPLHAAMSLDLERFPLGWDGADVTQRLYRLGRTQKELAANVGVAQQTLNRWCLNNKVPPKYVDPVKATLLKWVAEFNTDNPKE